VNRDDLNGDDLNRDDLNGDDLNEDDAGRPAPYRRDRRPYLIALGLGVASGVLGLRWGDALLVGLVTGVIGVAVLAAGAGRSYGWPAERRVEAPGARREISALTWTFLGLDGHVTEAAVRRLRADATRRLAQRGIVIPGGLGATTATSPDIDDDLRTRARDALGERAWAILVRPGGSMPSLADVAHCVDVVERLAADQSPKLPAPPSRRA
jgi:hypothetical protein